MIWIERKPGAVWAVGRAVNPHLRPSDDHEGDDYVFEGYELEDALEPANTTLEDDLPCPSGTARRALQAVHARECLKPLEAWFFGRSACG